MASPPSPLRAQARSVLAIARKELLESLRDKQTVIYAFVLPICMYPVLFWFMLQGAMVLEGQKDRTAVTLGVAGIQAEGGDQSSLSESLLEALSGRAAGAEAPTANRMDVNLAEDPLTLEEAREWIAQADGDSAPDAVLYLNPVKILYDSTKSASEIAHKRARQRLERHTRDLRVAAAEAAGLDAEDLEPVSVQSVDLAEKGAKGAVVLASLLPLLLVVMAVMGSFFPAVDLTAGEKERGTAETTLLVPLPRSSVILGKIFAVSLLALTATALSLFALAFSAEHLLSTLASRMDVSVSIPPIALVGAAPLAALFSLFVSAVLTAVASLASTFKEGQALLGPVQMVFILPAMIGIIPGIELSYGWACVPVVNVVLAFRAMLMGQPLYAEYMVTALSLVFYGYLALRLAVHMLSRESVLLSGKTIPLSKLFATLRGSSTSR